jgi:hypothetical protein
MTDVLLVQLPIPQLNYGRQSGNIPLGAACLKQAAAGLPSVRVDLLPESVATYLGDAALLARIADRRPDIVGFTVFCWNVHRSVYLAENLKTIYNPRIVFGGPEITPDNPVVDSPAVDFSVFGEGEAVFQRLLSDPALWRRRSAAAGAEALFVDSPSPYLEGLLEPQIENMLLLETQRGCPYRCGYCYYNKSRQGIALKDEARLLDAVRWAQRHGIAEVFLLDPTLNVRPGLSGLLGKFAGINRGGSPALLSEIRAETVDASLADRFAAAGFSWFEVGLQSTNPRALAAMNRPTDLARFVAGASRLKTRGITVGVDLIAGLPGDDPQGFRRSVDFVFENRFTDDVQVFPLSVLPGTEFRKSCRSLGLRYHPDPPYPVLTTPAFSEADLLAALDYAEVRFDVCLYPMPDLDVAWRRAGAPEGGDHYLVAGDRRCLRKLVLTEERPPEALTAAARELAHPYQVIFGPGVRRTDYMAALLEQLTSANPFTPLELVFIEPAQIPDTDRLLERTRLRRPGFLDIDQRYLFAAPGNRSILFTLVSEKRRPVFTGDMQRQVHHWRNPELPTRADLKALARLDGIVIDAPAEPGALAAWQKRFARYATDYLHIGFADIDRQRHWLEITDTGNYYLGAFT